MVLIPPTKRPSGGRTLGNHEARVRVLERALARFGPLDGFIRYDFENVGDWLYVETTEDAGSGPNGWGQEFVDSGGSGFHFDTTGYYQVDADGRFNIEAQDLIHFTGHNDFDVDLDGTDFNLATVGGDIILDAYDGATAGGQIYLHSDFETYLQLSPGPTGGGMIFEASNPGATMLFETDHSMFFQTFGATSYIQMSPNFDVNFLLGKNNAYISTGGSSPNDITMLPGTDGFLVHGGPHDFRLFGGETFTVYDGSGNPKIRWTEGTNDLHIPTGGVVVADL